jgi:putative membrane protein
MDRFANILTGIVAGIHLLIMLVELFAWKFPAVHGRLGFSQPEAYKTAPIVANAGLYNGFLAAGLLWSLFSTENSFAPRLFFLSCVVVAGIFGAVTLKWTTLLLQSIPASAAMVMMWVASSS